MLHTLVGTQHKQIGSVIFVGGIIYKIFKSSIRFRAYDKGRDDELETAC